MKSMLRFGPAGMPIALKGKSLVEGIKYCISKGLLAFEIEWVRGVRVRKGIENDVKKIVKANDVLLSAHAPYWINPCSRDAKIIATTLRNLKQCAIAASKLDVARVVFHPGYYGSYSEQEAFNNAVELLKEFFEWQEQQGLSIVFAAETTGKKSQFGSLNEVLKLCKKFKLIEPCIDFAHLHARENGAIKSKEDYEAIIKKVADELGKKALKNLHIHFSGIRYGKTGEREHLPIKSKSPDFRQLAELMVEKNYAFNIICESPLLDIDALKMLQLIEKLKRER